MTPRLALAFAACGVALVACHDSGSDTSQVIAVKLRDCGLIGQGKVNPYVGDSALGQCRAKCRADATCEELQNYYCNDTISARMNDCNRACLNPQPCADGNGTYRVTQRCDGQKDCSDGSDENNCPQVSDQGPKYCASSGARIYDYQRCDGYDDCGDGTDEKGCPNPSPTFRCVRKVGNLVQEIPLDKVCDLEPDCVDMSDESPDQGCAMLQCK